MGGFKVRLEFGETYVDVSVPVKHEIIFGSGKNKRIFESREFEYLFIRGIYRAKQKQLSILLSHICVP